MFWNRAKSNEITIKVFYVYNEVFSPKNKKVLLKKIKVPKDEYHGMNYDKTSALIVLTKNGENSFYRYEAPMVPGFGGFVQSNLKISVK